MYSFDERIMHRCLDLAQLGAGCVSPNPMVGAVLVHEGRIIGEGFHKQSGTAHAEVNCIENVQAADKHLIPEAHLFVSLEPCNHFGKTPACSHRIVMEGIKKVSVACMDSNEKVNGAGIQYLRENGVDVKVGLLAKEALHLNRRFFTFQKHKRPYVILKWAATADGFIAPQNGERMQISNAISQKLVHQWRAEEAAILVGSGTALTDNPQLNVRYAKGKNPLRILWDKHLTTPTHFHLINDEAATLIFNGMKMETVGTKEFILNTAEDYIAATMNLLNQRSLDSLLVEGGAKVLQAFIDEGFWDECRIFRSPKTFGDGLPAPQLKDAVWQSTYPLGTDNLEIFTAASNSFYHPHAVLAL